MKTHKCNLLKKGVFLVEFKDLEHMNNTLALKGLLMEWDGIEVTLLGKPDEISEEDVREFVEKVTTTQYKNYSKVPNYFEYLLNTALESFWSALEREIYWENPVSLEREKVHRQIGDTFTADGILKCWHDAQSRTFDRNRMLIFIEN